RNNHRVQAKRFAPIHEGFERFRRCRLPAGRQVKTVSHKGLLTYRKATSPHGDKQPQTLWFTAIPWATGLAAPVPAVSDREDELAPQIDGPRRGLIPFVPWIKHTGRAIGLDHEPRQNGF